MLKQSKKSIPEVTPDYTALSLQTDKAGIIISASADLLSFTGKHEEELIGNSFKKIIDAADKPKLQALLNTGIDAGLIVQLALKGKAGVCLMGFTAKYQNNRSIPGDIIDWNAVPLYKPAAASTTDAETALQKVRQELQEVTDRYKTFVQQSSEIIWRCELPTPISINDPEEKQLQELFDGYLAECNDQMAHFYGFENTAGIIGKKVSVFFDPKEPVTEQVVREFIQQGYKIYRRLSMHFDHQGNKRYFINNLVGIVENGKLLRVWTTQNEITQLRMAEKANRYQASVLENVFDAILSTGPDFLIKSWNQAAEKLYGISAETVMGHTIQEFISFTYHNTSRDKLLEELYATGACSGEVSFVRPADGKKIIISCAVTLLKNNKGHITDIISINKDITERKQAEQAIREGEKRFRQFADAAPVIIWVADDADNTIYVNKCFEQFTGITLNELEGNSWKKIVHQADLPIAIEKYKRYFNYREPVVLEYRLKNKDNEYRWVLDHGVPRFLEDGTFIGYIGSIVDIHDRKLAEEKIRFQVQVMQDVSEGIISTDLDFNIISFNKAAENIYGIPGHEIIGKRLNDFIKLSYLSNTWEEALQHLHEYGSWEGQAYYNRHDGKRIYLNCALSFVKNDRGTRIGVAGIYRDITETRQSQENLRINEERYRSVVHALGEGILMYDKNGEIIACNRSAEMILNVPANVLIGRFTGVGNACIYEDGTPFPPQQHPSLITLKTGRSLQNVIMGFQRSDGSLVWISINTEPVYYTEQRVHPDAVVSSFVDITQKKAAEIELKQSQQQLREYSERITNILASITDGFIAVDKNLNIFLWNHAVEHITGLDAKQVIGTSVEEIFPHFAGTAAYQQYRDAINKGRSSTFEHFLPAFGRWLETSVYPFSQGAFIYFRDITDRKKQERLLELEKEVLAINAQPTASLKTTIDYFLDGLEKTFPGMFCSVITLSDDKQTIQHLSGPSLPDEFTSAINGLKIGPRVASCGTAMYLKETVISVDIETDPLWDGYRTLIQKLGLRSCWSFPIVGAGNEVLATIAVYHTHPSTPTEAEFKLFERVSSLLRIIIENKNAELKIRLSNERYLLVTKATNDAIWDWDVNTNSLYWGEGIYTLFGIKPGYVDNAASFWESCIHPEDRERVVNGINRFLKDSTSKIWEDEYRFIKPNGEYALVFDRGFLIFDRSGKVARMVGSMQDITDKKELEKKLLKQEVDKQKIIAQAVVNAQEKERAEIGKELHDNVNQILSTAKLYLELAQTDDDSRLDLINRSTKNISDAINEIRTISRSLVPPSIGDLGLIESVQDLVENIKATKKLHVEFYYSGTIDNILDEKRKLMLFRIIQEQVNNVLKHASAQNLVIELIADSEGCAVDLTISDDGKGFELDKVRSKKGVGLSNIASRAQLFNGSVHVVTALGEGCKLKINVPISNI
ncbi:PAS domain S-box protein [Longitalea arenae]|uniref:PAS domain S-box protein n=1 Tax=Longitalea arenae TaxID=2812558 RepID=UPI001967713A|nr:PAS domain S-box protein [Longitalea arenae]